MEKTIGKQRIDYLDIAKGIGIIMVVWAHAGGPFSRYIYQMHMPYFFLISGLLYSSNASLKEYTLKKVKSLYIPFAFWNILFYTVKSVRHGVAASSIFRTVVDIALTLSKDGQYFGATWFLGALFVVSIIYKAFDILIKESKYKDYLMLVLSGTFCVIAFNITFPHMLSRTIICGFFFALGVFTKRHRSELQGFDCFGTALACGCLFLIIAHYGSANMGANQYKFPFLFIVGALMASYAILYLCKEFDLRVKILMPVKKFLMYLGKHSIDIVIWQFVAFRIVIILQMYLNSEEITWSGVLSYYPCYSTDHGWWIVYTLVGLLVPVLFCSLLRSGPWGKVLKKLHIV